jgi:hypothetical protein
MSGTLTPALRRTLRPSVALRTASYQKNHRGYRRKTDQPLLTLTCSDPWHEHDAERNRADDRARSIGSSFS